MPYTNLSKSLRNLIVDMSILLLGLNFFSLVIGLTGLHYRNCNTPSRNYMVKVSEIYSKLAVKTPEWRHLHCSSAFIDNFEHISHLVLVFLKDY